MSGPGTTPALPMARSVRPAACTSLAQHHVPCSPGISPPAQTQHKAAQRLVEGKQTHKAADSEECQATKQPWAYLQAIPWAGQPGLEEGVPDHSIGGHAMTGHGIQNLLTAGQVSSRRERVHDQAICILQACMQGSARQARAQLSLQVFCDPQLPHLEETEEMAQARLRADADVRLTMLGAIPVSRAAWMALRAPLVLHWARAACTRMLVVYWSGLKPASCAEASSCSACAAISPSAFATPDNNPDAITVAPCSAHAGQHATELHR